MDVLDALSKIAGNLELFLVIFIPGSFLSILFIPNFHAYIISFELPSYVIQTLELVMFLSLSFAFGFTTHYITLVVYSKIVRLLKLTKDGKPTKEIAYLYRNFFSNMSITFPIFIGFIFNYIWSLICFVMFFILTIKLYDEIEKSKKKQ